MLGGPRRNAQRLLVSYATLARIEFEQCYSKTGGRLKEFAANKS